MKSTGGYMDENCLKVQMLGDFKMEYQGRAIAFERNVMTKTNQLLQILIQAGKNGIPREKLMKQLFGNDEITNPSNSLRATVFRLRKLLAAEGFPEDDYIMIKCGMYRWTSRIPVELDVKEFERKANEALSCEDDRIISLLKEACEAYSGEFLPQLANEEWAVVLNVYYKNLYVACMKRLCVLLEEHGEFETLLCVATKAVGLYPFEEWQIWQIDSLVALNKEEEAMKVYEDTVDLFYEELGIAPSENMTERLTQMRGKIQNQTRLINDIQKKLSEHEDDDGAYYCSYPGFVENYRYIRRVISRSGQAAVLLLCTIVDGKGICMDKGDRLNILAEELGTAIKGSLRRGDLYTRYSANQYLMLLMELKQEDATVVIKRINSYFEHASRKNYLKYHSVPVCDTQEKDGQIHFELTDSIWK